MNVKIASTGVFVAYYQGHYWVTARRVSVVVQIDEHKALWPATSARVGTLQNGKGVP